MTSSALLGRCVRLLFLAAVALLAQPAFATINCEITPDSVTTLIANTGDNLSVGYTVGGGGCGSEATTTTTIITDTTGGNVSPPSESTVPGSRISFINVGPVAGTMVVRIECTSGCFGSPANLTIDYTVTATVPVSLNLGAVGPTTFNAEQGTTRNIQVIADDNGVPAGTTILWSASGPVSLSSTSTNTNAAGVGTVVATFGPGTGPASIFAARVDNTDSPVNFAITVTPPIARTIGAVSGNGQTAPTNSPLPNPLVVEAIDNGLPAPGIGIAWSIVSGDATLVSPTSPTDTSGRAQTGLLFGANPGPVVVRATRIDEPTIQTAFTVTSTLVRTLSALSGNNQNAPTQSPLPNPLVVEARNNGSAIAGIGITWSVVSGDATLVAPTATTDTSGRAQTGLLLGATPGAIVVRARRSDDPVSTLDFNATRFSIEGEPIDSSFFRIGGGLSVLFAGGRSGFVYVERVVGKSGFTQTNLALGIRGEF